MQRIDRIDTMDKAVLEREREALRDSRWNRWRSMLRYVLLVVSIIFGGPPAVELARMGVDSGAASAAEPAPASEPPARDAAPAPPRPLPTPLPRCVVLPQTRARDLVRER